MIVGRKFYQFTEIGSTNEYVKSELGDAPEGTVVIADVQTAGKGRMGRDWYSPEGGLWMSVLLRHSENCLIPLTAGVAICEALRNYSIRPNIKWPNDILLHGKKVAGILTEVIDDRVILGMGINLNVRQFPDDLTGRASSILIETKKHFDAQTFCQHLCKALDENYMILKDEQVDTLLAKWRNYSVMLDRDVRIKLPDRTVVGRVLDIDRRGALIVVRADYGVEHIIAGDCRLLN
jgi:BirA family biotin operon repressor/biotin-[acetyl-CoA-carboxylase] ligase